MNKVIGFTIGFVLGIIIGNYFIKVYEPRQPLTTIISAEEPDIPEVVSNEPVRTYQSGEASWYGQEYCDRYSPECITASGEKFDESLLTCACSRSIPLGSYIKFTYQGNSVVAKCNDRGAFEKAYGRVADLSKATFLKLAPLEKGVLQVQYEVL